MPSDFELAQQARRWLDTVAPNDPDALTAAISGDLHREFARVFPEAKRRFGPAALRAATQPAPPGCCAWGAAERDARVHGTKRPGFSVAVRTLLVGAPCTRCTNRLRAELSAQVDAGRRVTSTSPATRQGARSRSLMSSAGSGALHHFGCTTCTAARTAVRAGLAAGLTASAAMADEKAVELVAAAFTPHAAKLAPTGRIGIRQPRLHEVEGGKETCNCSDCKSGRSAQRQRLTRQRRVSL
jgi:hypothetical protein